MKIHIFISGKVQGVFFRAYTSKKAEELGLKGWVRNLDDGRVEAVFEGEEEKVKEMIKWCSKGPPGAKVEKVSTYGSDYSTRLRQLADHPGSPPNRRAGMSDPSTYVPLSGTMEDKTVDKDSSRKSRDEEKLNKFEIRY